VGLRKQGNAALHHPGPAHRERLISNRSRAKFRAECLNEHRFLALENARETIENWRIDYNRVRPHSSLGYLTPEEFRLGYANVESQHRFPHLHSSDGGEIISLLNSTASTLTYPD
jgi:putative transposase